MIWETVSSESSRAENQIGWKAEQATLVASVPVIAAVFGAHPASSITSSAGTSNRIIHLPHATQHGFRLSRLEQPLVANVRGDCRGELQEEAEKGKPHQYGGVAPSRWRSQT